MRRHAAAIALFSAAVALAGEPAGRPAEVDELGLELVTQNCHMCHAPELLDQQRLTAKQWQAVGKKMEGWGAPLDEGDQELLAAYLAARHPVDAGSFTPAEVDGDVVRRALAPAPDPPLPPGNKVRGATLFAERCAACHGPDARGGRTGTNLVGRLALRRGEEFARVVRNGRHRMPAFGTTDAELADLLAYLRLSPR